MIKRTVLILVLLSFFSACDVAKMVATDVVTVINTVPTQTEAAEGLKDALKQGFSNGVSKLSQTGAFNNNQLIKILLPEDAQKIADKLRSIGMGAQVDQVIHQLNEGAEKAVATAKPIFINAVTNMSFNDAMSILTGGNGAATNYLKQNTSTAIQSAFKPEIQKALNQVGFTAHWTDLVAIYNKIPLVTKLNPDLNQYVTDKAMKTLYDQVEQEENAIRADPAKRLTDLMKKAFNYADTKK